MMGMDIPEKAVEAAARETYRVAAEFAYETDSWDDLSDGQREAFVEDALTILDAAAPMLAEAFAQGWREGAGIAAPVDLDTGEPMHDQAAQPAYNPYRSQA